MIDLEPLYSNRRILADKPIDNAGIVAAVSQGDLDFSEDPRVGGIEQLRRGRRDLLIRTRSQRNNHSDQKHEAGYFCHFSFSALINSFLLRGTVAHRRA
jgi:hypothetical protein